MLENKSIYIDGSKKPETWSIFKMWNVVKSDDVK